MSLSIHKMNKEGKIIFRIWCSITDTYITEELSEEELRDQLLFEKILTAISYFRGNDIPRSIERAEKLEKWEKEQNIETQGVDPEFELIFELAKVALEAIKKRLEQDNQSE